MSLACVPCTVRMLMPRPCLHHALLQSIPRKLAVTNELRDDGRKILKSLNELTRGQVIHHEVL